MPIAQFQPQVRFVLPPDQGGGTLSVDAAATASELTAILTDTWTSGIYEAQLAERPSGQLDSRRFAVNIDPTEGALERLDGRQLADRLEGITYHYQQARDLVYDADRLAGPNLGKYFMLLLIVLLLGEQLLAYATSYHPAAGRLAPGTATKGKKTRIRATMDDYDQAGRAAGSSEARTPEPAGGGRR
jgi:hypothetical protein